jgi:outer membrane protein, heavy metal efflux system
MKTKPFSLLLVAAAALAVPRAALAAEFPTLDVAIQKAKARSLAVIEAEGELGVANASLTGAKVSSLANPYTEIQVDKPWTRNTEVNGSPAPGNVPDTIQALSFTYFPIDIGGQRGKRIEEAERLIGWRRMGLITSQASAAGEAVSTYGELVVSAQRIVEATAGEATAREEAKYFQGRFEAKDTTIYEKSIAEAEVARWVQSRVEAELRVHASLARFAQVTGTPDPSRPPPNTLVIPPPLKAEWDDTMITRLVDKSPLIGRLQAERNYWDASIARYEREKIPPVAFEVIAGRGGSGELRLGGGAVITFPITRRYQGEIARAEFSREHVLRHIELFRSVAITRLRAARDAITSVARALDELDKTGIPALERAVTSSVEGFRAGKIDLTRAMLARRDLAIARARRLDLLEASWRAYADLVIFSGELP